MNTAEVTCILNVFKRPQWFEEQLNAILNQSVPPKHIIIWNNNQSVDLSKYSKIHNITIFTSSKNMGVWSRFFSQYFLLSGKYICVFDDDTIPGKNWFKNCIDTMNKYNALLGTIGLHFNKGDKYKPIKRYGWDGPIQDARYVDIVGHSWFFKKEWIDILTKELPNIDEIFFTCGEDIHLSYVLQKYLNIPTIVPPHPQNDISLWGADKNKSLHYGNVDSTFVDTGIDKFDKALSFYIHKGWETIANKNNKIKIYDNCLEYFLDKIKRKECFALIRSADGEYCVSRNISLTNIDNWTFTSGSILNKHLNETFELINTNVYYGITGYTNSKDICDYYYSLIFNKPNITFANIFANQNYRRWVEFLSTFDDNCVLISSNINDKKTIGKLRVIDHVKIEPTLVNTWDNNYSKYLNTIKNIAKKYDKTIFLISAGPLANVFIYHMYLSNSKNIYIDCGSSIDVFNKTYHTREYQYKNTYQNEIDLPFQI